MARILMVASEARPFAYTGGLADVLGSLPGALRGVGHDVAVVMPRYGSVSLDGAERVWQNLQVYLGSHFFSCDIWRRDHHGVAFYFVECPLLFDRAGLYGPSNTSAYGDNHLRFAAFCHGALGVLRFLFRADVVHLHDWQAALCAPYLRTRYNLDPTFRGTRVVFTIHNQEHQGRFGPAAFGELGLDGWLFQRDFLEFHGDVNLMKGGVIFSDRVTTVSPRYAEEIQTPEFGHGLDGLLRARAAVLTGILNGIDYREWNPQTDPHLAAHYSTADLAGKLACKTDLLREFNLPDDRPGRPLIGIVSRFAKQKGFETIFPGVAWELMAGDVGLVVVGSGNAGTEALFRQIEHAYPGRVGTYFGYNNQLAHKVEAGADIFLMPSEFEPCGLNQMYSMRYGTVPVVRATGGLDSTVDGDTGFKFWGYWPGDFLAATQLALQEYSQRPDAWRRRMLAGMSRDFSWEASARRYSQLYEDLLRQQS